MLAVMDFGSQYTHLIARRIRQLNVYSEIFPFYQDVADTDVEAVILSGGPSSVYRENAPRNDALLDWLFAEKIPTLGICYGLHLIAQHFGGKVVKGKEREYGTADAFVVDDPLFKELDITQKVWMSHGDRVEALPPGFSRIASTENSEFAAFRCNTMYAVQWHPEVHHTENGMKMLSNFLEIAGATRDWHLEDFTRQTVAELREKIPGNAVIGLSGGVDSSVAATLVSRAIGTRLTAVFVDHGLLPAGEVEQVRTWFEGKVTLEVISAKDRFFSKLKGVLDPEEKRRVIGEEFIRIFEEEARKVKATTLVQGTIYPDRIESGITQHADVIKSHHNVGALPEVMEFEQVVEPLQDLYKDEVREVGKTLGLPDDILRKHPFPGPGLAVRVLGEVNDQSIIICRKACTIVEDELKAAGLYNEVWQGFAVLFEDKVVGVVGDERNLGNVVGIRIVQSLDAMTANFVKVDWDVLERMSTRITNEIPEVVSVAYFVSHKPPQTIEPL
ncbi:MAG: glutamine-hydrolyzing GMP synthase [Theionarchaea archaeon]|nr:glutamine-hydrolyzing GMP synthase [Theionarchaea archaeon]MBU7037707.1 glutamine-hydrolyzing GMP synthase [Theionarchaea archaeon]